MRVSVSENAHSKLKNQPARFSVQVTPKPESLADDEASQMELIHHVLLNLLDWQLPYVDWSRCNEARFDSSFKITGDLLTRTTCAFSQSIEWAPAKAVKRAQ